MTLRQAFEQANSGVITTKASWAENGEHKYIIPHGAYTKTVDGLYSGTMKEILEKLEAKEVNFIRHYDLLTVLPDGTATLQVGWTPSAVEFWADDYICATTKEPTEAELKPLTEEEVSKLNPGDVIDVDPNESLVETAQKHGHETEIVISNVKVIETVDNTPDALLVDKAAKKPKRGKPEDGSEGEE